MNDQLFECKTVEEVKSLFVEAKDFLSLYGAFIINHSNFYGDEFKNGFIIANDDYNNMIVVPKNKKSYDFLRYFPNNNTITTNDTYEHVLRNKLLKEDLEYIESAIKIDSGDYYFKIVTNMLNGASQHNVLHTKGDIKTFRSMSDIQQFFSKKGFPKEDVRAGKLGKSFVVIKN